MRSAEERLTSAGSPFELCTTQIEGVQCASYRHAPRTLPELLQKIRRTAAKATMSTGDTCTAYGQMWQRAGMLAAALAVKGNIRAGMRVGIAIGNGLEWPVAFLGTCMLGAVPVVVEPELRAADLYELLGQTECRAVVLDDLVADGLWALGCRLRTFIVDTAGRHARASRDWHYLEDYQSPANEAANAVAVEPQDLAIIACTSGTTSGQPKGVMIDHQGFITGLYNMMLGSALASARNAAKKTAHSTVPPSGSLPAALSATPLSHLGGYSGLLLNLLAGARLLLPGKWDAGEILAAIEHHKVTSISGATPRQIRELLRAPAAGGRLASILSFTFFGSALQLDLVEEIAAVIPHATVATGYGMTETNGSVCIAAGAELCERPETSGPPVPTVELAIKDPAGRNVPLGVEGEIWLRGGMLMRGYCQSPERTARTLVDGWLRTGDLGCLEEGQFLRVIDRQDDFVECQGRAVPCSRVEGLVRGHLQVDEVVALDVERPVMGRQLVLVIVPKPGNPVESVGVGERIKSLLPVATDADVRIVLREDVPRTLRGKVDRRALRNQVAQG